MEHAINRRPNRTFRGILTLIIVAVVAISGVFLVSIMHRHSRTDLVVDSIHDAPIEPQINHAPIGQSWVGAKSALPALPARASESGSKRNNDLAVRLDHKTIARTELEFLTDRLARSGPTEYSNPWAKAAANVLDRLRGRGDLPGVQYSSLLCFREGCEFAFTSADSEGTQGARDALTTGAMYEFPGVKYVTAVIPGEENVQPSRSSVTVILYSPGHTPELTN